MPTKPIPLNPKVLTQTEIEHLLKVPTSQREARHMKQRFIEVIKMLDNHDYYPKKLGALDCPHCMTAYKKSESSEHFNCEECAYKDGLSETEISNFIDPDSHNPSFYCIKFFTFGNISLRQIESKLILNRDDVYLNLPIDKITEGKIRIFSLGHIQWANIILQKKKTTNPTTPPRKTKKKKCGWCDGTGKESDYYKTYPCTHCGGTGKEEIIDQIGSEQNKARLKKNKKGIHR